MFYRVKRIITQKGMESYSLRLELSLAGFQYVLQFGALHVPRPRSITEALIHAID
jgi:hypothetical protein